MIIAKPISKPYASFKTNTFYIILNNFIGNIFDKEIKKMIRTNNSHKHKTLKLN